jgi:hypothetical protein
MIRKLIKIVLYLVMVSVLTFIVYQGIFLAILTYYIFNLFV